MNIPDVDVDPRTWFFDLLGTYDQYGRFKNPRWLAGVSDTQVRYDLIGYFDTVSRLKPDMGRFRDPDSESAIPDVLYSQDYAPPIISDPDDSHISTSLVPSALVPKVKMNTPKEFRVGQDA